jgi:uroporphyrin-III C-methyltransferase/precorrin-2 dehydrogenase/sirohydrochlorin ferrochelatase
MDENAHTRDVTCSRVADYGGSATARGSCSRPAAGSPLLRIVERKDGDARESTRMGRVFLIGCGPGDPELLTLRAARLMREADVALYDHLVAPEIVAMVRADAQRIYVGKERSRHTLPQDEINGIMVALALQGKRVLRLKGGDPIIFGRGGEELEALARYGIPFEVVPGITAATGVAAYAGIPLTHRDHAHSCVFVTGHLRDGTMNLDWPALARPNQTVVVYMGLLGLPLLCQQLVRHGLPPHTPAAIVQQGTTRTQRIVVGTLDTLPLAAAKAGIQPPTLIIIGTVVGLHERLAWFEPQANRESAAADPSPMPVRA